MTLKIWDNSNLKRLSNQNGLSCQITLPVLITPIWVRNSIQFKADTNDHECRHYKVISGKMACMDFKLHLQTQTHTTISPKNGTREAAAINKSNWVTKWLLSLIPTQAANTSSIHLAIQKYRNLRALSAWKQMARQLVGISETLQYMLVLSPNSFCTQWHSCNFIMELKWGRVEDSLKELLIWHKLIVIQDNEHVHPCSQCFLPVSWHAVVVLSLLQQQLVQCW